jgi:hypothetical protein
MATDDDDAATLRERVRDLEATVAQQQDTIEQLMPSRRAILAGGAGLVGGAALTGQASAQSAAGQVGTSSEPVDVEAARVNAYSVNTDNATVNQSIDATGLNLSNDPLNPTIPFTFVGSDARTVRRHNDETVQGDNSATIIATTNPSEVGAIAGYFFVYGREQGSFDGFFDLVSIVNNRNPKTHLQNSRGTVTRTYSEDGSGRLEIAIDDGGNTYDISVQTIAADRS